MQKTKYIAIFFVFRPIYTIFAPEFINNCNYDSTYSFYRRRFDA